MAIVSSNGDLVSCTVGARPFLDFIMRERERLLSSPPILSYLTLEKEREAYSVNVLPLSPPDAPDDSPGTFFVILIKTLPSVGQIASQLTPREKEIYLSLLRGLSSKQIAKALKLSPATVHVHIRNIFRTVDVVSRSQLISKSLLEEMEIDNGA